MSWEERGEVGNELEQTWVEMKQKMAAFSELTQQKVPRERVHVDQTLEAMRHAAFTHDGTTLDQAFATFKEIWESEAFNGDEDLFFSGEEIRPLVMKYWNLKYMSDPSKF